MPRFLRVQNQMIHIPSVSNVSMGTNCWGRPTITLSFHSDKKVVCITYKNWDLCETEFNKIKDAVSEIESILKRIRLTESSAPYDEPQIVEEIKNQVKESEEIERGSNSLQGNATPASSETK